VINHSRTSAANGELKPSNLDNAWSGGREREESNGMILEECSCRPGVATSNTETTVEVHIEFQELAGAVVTMSSLSLRRLPRPEASSAWVKGNSDRHGDVRFSDLSKRKYRRHASSERLSFVESLV
jgi:hypothetical protein